MKECLFHLLAMESRADTTIAVEKYIVQLVHELPLPIARVAAVQFCAAESLAGGGDLNAALLTATLPAARHPLVSALPLESLFASLSVDTTMGVLSCLLTEQRVLFHSHSRTKLVRSVLAFQQLLHPFQWTSVCIPLLPASLLDACSIPQPYIIGVETFVLSELTDLTDLVIVDLDANCIRSTAALPRLPAHAAAALWSELRAIAERRVAAHDDLWPDPMGAHSRSEQCVRFFFFCTLHSLSSTFSVSPTSFFSFISHSFTCMCKCDLFSVSFSPQPLLARARTSATASSTFIFFAFVPSLCSFFSLLSLLLCLSSTWCVVVGRL